MLDHLVADSMELMFLVAGGKLTAEQRSYGPLADILDNYPGVAGTIYWLASLTVSSRLGNLEKDDITAEKRELVCNGRRPSELCVSCGGCYAVVVLL